MSESSKVPTFKWPSAHNQRTKVVGYTGHEATSILEWLSLCSCSLSGVKALVVFYRFWSLFEVQ